MRRSGIDARHSFYFHFRLPQHTPAFRQPETNPFYADVLARYAQAKAQFRATGTIAHTEFLDELGGGFSFGNWTEAAPIPSAFELTIRTLAGNQVDWDDPNNGISITLAGKPLYHIAWVAAYHYGCGGADAIMLFYEPDSRTVLFTFDWT